MLNTMPLPAAIQEMPAEKAKAVKTPNSRRSSSIGGDKESSFSSTLNAVQDKAKQKECQAQNKSERAAAHKNDKRTPEDQTESKHDTTAAEDLVAAAAVTPMATGNPIEPEANRVLSLDKLADNTTVPSTGDEVLPPSDLQKQLRLSNQTQYGAVKKTPSEQMGDKPVEINRPPAEDVKVPQVKMAETDAKQPLKAANETTGSQTNTFNRNDTSAALAVQASASEADTRPKSMKAVPETLLPEGDAPANAKSEKQLAALLRDHTSSVEGGSEKAHPLREAWRQQARTPFQHATAKENDAVTADSTKSQTPPQASSPGSSGSLVSEGGKEIATGLANDDQGHVTTNRAGGLESSLSMPTESTMGKTASVTGGSATTHNQAATETFRQENFHQLVEKALFTVRDGQSEARIALKPDHLGQVQMKIVTENNHVTIKIVTDSAVARDLIDGSAHQLKSELQQQGLNIEAIEVSVSDEQRDANRGARQREEMLRHLASRRQGSPEEEEGQPQKHAQHRRQAGYTKASGIDYFA